MQLTPELERRIEDEVRAGGYDSAADLVAAALDALHARRSALRDELERRYDEVEAGAVELLDGADVFSELRRKSEERRRARQ